MKYIRTLGCAALLLFLLPGFTKAVSAASVTISPSGSGVFVLSGDVFSDVAALDITITYDTTALANPKVVQGSLIGGAMMAINVNAPGSIRIAAVRTQPITGSGPVATISFNRTGSSQGRVLSMSAGLTNSGGASIPVQVLVSNPTETATDVSSPQGGGQTTASGGNIPSGGSTATTATTETGASTSYGPVSRYLGSSTISLSSETGKAAEQQGAAPALPAETGKPAEQQEAAPTVPEQPAAETTEGRAAETPAEPERQMEATSAPAITGEKKFVVRKSVLEKFREYSRGKTPQSLTALFESALIPGVRQEPTIVLSDGKTTVKLFIQIGTAGKAAPNFALKGAKLVSLKMAGNAWVVEALPKSRVYEAAVTVEENGSLTEIPITVAPPIDTTIDPATVLGEKEFNLFLRERGTDKVPMFDLNKDGKRNYIDDYIFTANFIVKRGSGTKVKPAAKNNPKRKK